MVLSIANVFASGRLAVIEQVAHHLPCKGDQWHDRRVVNPGRPNDPETANGGVVTPVSC